MFALVMSVGVFFLTTDIDSYIFKMDKQAISQIIDNQQAENPDNENPVHHGVEDLFTVDNCIGHIADGIFFGNTVFITQRIEYKFTTQIWQPPKYS